MMKKKRKNQLDFKEEYKMKEKNDLCIGDPYLKTDTKPVEKTPRVLFWKRLISMFIFWK